METAAPAPIDLARVTSARRSLGVLLALAVLLPAGCEALFARQSRRLEALAAQGQTTAGVVISATSQSTEDRYEVNGRTHTWSVARERAPLPVGAPIAVRYLPEDPSFSRPTAAPEGVRDEVWGSLVASMAGSAGESAEQIRNSAERTRKAEGTSEADPSTAGSAAELVRRTKKNPEGGPGGGGRPGTRRRSRRPA